MIKIIIDNFKWLRFIPMFFIYRNDLFNMNLNFNFLQILSFNIAIILLTFIIEKISNIEYYKKLFNYNPTFWSMINVFLVIMNMKNIISYNSFTLILLCCELFSLMHIFITYLVVKINKNNNNNLQLLTSNIIKSSLIGLILTFLFSLCINKFFIKAMIEHYGFREYSMYSLGILCMIRLATSLFTKISDVAADSLKLNGNYKEDSSDNKFSQLDNYGDFIGDSNLNVLLILFILPTISGIFPSYNLFFVYYILILCVILLLSYIFKINFKVFHIKLILFLTSAGLVNIYIYSWYSLVLNISLLLVLFTSEINFSEIIIKKDLFKISKPLSAILGLGIALSLAFTLVILKQKIILDLLGFISSITFKKITMTRFAYTLYGLLLPLAVFYNLFGVISDNYGGYASSINNESLRKITDQNDIIGNDFKLKDKIFILILTSNKSMGLEGVVGFILITFVSSILYLIRNYDQMNQNQIFILIGFLSSLITFFAMFDILSHFSFDITTLGISFCLLGTAFDNLKKKLEYSDDKDSLKAAISFDLLGDILKDVLGPLFLFQGLFINSILNTCFKY